MIFLLRVVFGCWALLLLITGSVVSLAHTQPVADPLPELHECGYKFCLLTIEPGKTPRTEANAVLLDLPTPKYGLSVNDQLYSFNVFLIPDHYHPIADLIGGARIYVSYKTKLPLNTFLARFGAPCAAFIEFSEAQLFYSGMQVTVYIADHKIHPTAKVHSILLSNELSPCGLGYGGSAVYPWRGFTFHKVRTW